MAKKKNEMIAMILAGGQGSRLREITDRIAKPAVPFGGKYRIIDFALSNCSNSSIDTVGVVTQYQPLELTTHIGIGSSWDLDKNEGGVKILSPYFDKVGGVFYKGTANAVYENMAFIDSYDPEYVLILSGDHIYKMDYQKMLNVHINNNADLTIAVLEVPWEEAPRFGLLHADDDDKIYDFEEKPPVPKSNLASMGIYIFKWKVLKQKLIDDNTCEGTSFDFGKDIIPKMVFGDDRVYAYRFKGYWKDVGTVESLWEANMDLISLDNALGLHDRTWRNYSVNTMSPPHFITDTASVELSLINEGCIIKGNVKYCVISTDVYIGVNSKIRKSVIMPNVVIEDDCHIEYAIVISNVRVPKGTKIVGTQEEIAVYAGETGGTDNE